MRKISVIGLGYVGLPTASMLATKGFYVYGLDVDPNVVAELAAGRTRIEERDLDTLVLAAVQSGKPTGGLVDRWPPAQRTECAGAPQPGEICVPGGAKLNV